MAPSPRWKRTRAPGSGFAPGALVLVAVALAAPAARGEDAAVADVTPPVAQGSTDVPYPAGAEGDAAVVLELVVEADGTVSSAEVIEGAAPFAAQARAAVLTWTFAPARRGEAAVPARIRARVEFQRERPPADAGAPVSSPASAPAAASTAGAPPPPEAPLEVVVRGHRRDVGQTTLSAADVREMPGAFGDPFRAIEALPSVAPVVSGLPYFYIRGAPPNTNSYSVDGIRVPLLFHLGVGQGVIHPALIDEVDFFPGVAPAAHGDTVGATIAGRTREPATRLRGEASLRLVDAGGLVEAPVAGGRGTVLAAARYGYPGPILGAITDDLTLDYWDYQARTTWRAGSRGTLSLFAFGSHDALATPSPSGDPTAPPIEQFVSDFHRLDLRYDHALAAGGRVRLAVTGGADRRGAAPTYVTARSAAARLEIDARPWAALRVRGGAVARLESFGFRQSALGPGDPIPVPSSADPPPTNLNAAAHADLGWRVTPRIELVPGVRFEVFDSWRAGAPGDTGRVRTTVPTVDPRLAARVALSPALAWLSTFGIAHQYPALRAGDIPAPFVSVPGFPFGDSRPQRAVQASQGVEVSLPAEVTLGATGFLSRWSGLTDLTNATCVPVGDPPVVQCPADRPVSGQAYGLELLARRPLSRRLGGWLSYTLSRSVRDARLVTPGGEIVTARVASEFDRTHVVNAVAAYDLGRSWRAGLRTVFYTGTPYSQTDAATDAPVPPYHGYRNPAFFRLDLRVEKRWALGQGAWVALVIEGQNVTLSTELVTFGQDCMGMPGGATRCRTTRSRIGPLTIPSLGVQASF